MTATRAVTRISISAVVAIVVGITPALAWSSTRHLCYSRPKAIRLSRFVLHKSAIPSSSNHDHRQTSSSSSNGELRPSSFAKTASRKKHNNDSTTKPEITTVSPKGTNNSRQQSPTGSTATTNTISYSEASRQFRRTNYSPEDWLRHRSSDRFLRNLATIFQSGVVRQLLREVMLVAVIGCLVVVYNTVGIEGYDDAWSHHHEPIWPEGPLLSLPSQPFTLSSPALGLLLVFRTNASYSRWRDGRMAWGSIVNNCRSILRTTFTWVHVAPQQTNNQNDHANDNNNNSYNYMKNETSISGSDDEDATQAALQRLATAVWLVPRSLKRHLYREAEDGAAYAQDVYDRLPAATAGAMLEARHKPTRAQFELSSAVEALPIEYLRRIEIEKGTIELCNACGACERISSSPVPLLYSRHTARFLALWLLLLPLALYREFSNSWNHIAMIPASMVIAFFFFGIEELAVQLEEPFSILPLQTMVDGIELSCHEHLQWWCDEQQRQQQQHGDTNNDDEQTKQHSGLKSRLSP